MGFRSQRRSRISFSLKGLAGLLAALSLGPAALAQDPGAAVSSSSPDPGSLVIACVVAPGRLTLQGFMLTESLRDFGGEMSQTPVWFLAPELESGFSEAAQEQMKQLGVELFTFPITEELLRFPFAPKAFAAAAAESLAAGRYETLAWMGTDSFVLQTPTALRLPAGRSFGYRPVDLLNVASPFDGPIDPFWSNVYRDCSVVPDQVFPMTTNVDRVKIRACFNAGTIVVRPEKGILRQWRNTFRQIHMESDYTQIYRNDRRYAVFMPQAVLSGVVLAQVPRSEMHELPALANFPLHLFTRYPRESRPKSMNELITCRYDVLLEDPTWNLLIPIEEPLKSWLDRRLGKEVKSSE